MREKQVLSAIIAVLSVTAIAVALLVTLAYNWEPKEHETIEIKEYLAGSAGEGQHFVAEVSRPYSYDRNDIQINGVWAKEFVTVSIKSDNLKYSSEIETIARQAINGPIPYYNLTGWHIVFHTMLSTAGRSSTHLILPDDNTSAADISIKFTNDRSAEGNRAIAGVSTIDIAPNGTINRAQLTIYDSDSFHEQGILVPIVIHELGHALGLGHSTNYNSIMYPNLVTRNNIVGGDISICEIAALNALYVVHQNVTGFIQCE